MAPEGAVLCESCKRAVWESDVDAQGKCSHCQNGEPQPEQTPDEDSGSKDE